MSSGISLINQTNLKNTPTGILYSVLATAILTSLILHPAKNKPDPPVGKLAAKACTSSAITAQTQTTELKMTTKALEELIQYASTLKTK